jgi:hypothetical protein
MSDRGNQNSIRVDAIDHDERKPIEQEPPSSVKVACKSFRRFDDAIDGAFQFA